MIYADKSPEVRRRASQEYLRLVSETYDWPESMQHIETTTFADGQTMDATYIRLCGNRWVHEDILYNLLTFPCPDGPDPQESDEARDRRIMAILQTVH